VRDTSFDPELEANPSALVPVRHVLAVFAGGLLGTLARYEVLRSWLSQANHTPWALIAINATGSLVIGLLATGLFERRPHLVGLRLFCSSGFLGGWTTYSSYAATTLLLVRYQSWNPIFILSIATIIVNPLLTWAGRFLGAPR
jgi:fluoride exporter